MLAKTSHFAQNFDVFPYAGEIILLVGILFVLLHFTFQEVFHGNYATRSYNTLNVHYSTLIEYSSRVSVFILSLTLVFYLNLLSVYDYTVLDFFHGALILNHEILTFKAVLVFLAILILLVSETYFKSQAGAVGYFEYNILLLASVLGCLITLSSNDMLSFYISLEIQALAFYIMATIKKTSASSEAGLKYFIIGSFSSALLLFGISLVVLLTGHYNFDCILLALQFPAKLGLQESYNVYNTVTAFGAILIITALLIKLAVAPFHEWVADVYEGIMTPTALLFATIPKITNFFILVRLAESVFFVESIQSILQPYLMVVCLLSLIFGCLNALKQQNIKRFLAFSSVNHFGFIFMGIAHGQSHVQTLHSFNTVEAAFFYLSFYIVLTFGLWTGLIVFGESLSRITELGALLNRNAGLTFAFLLMLLSTGGIPPLAGFNAKISVFYALIGTLGEETQFFGLPEVILFVALVSSILSVYYYLRVIKILTFSRQLALTVEEPYKLSKLYQGTAINQYQSSAAYILAVVTAFNIFGFLLFI